MKYFMDEQINFSFGAGGSMKEGIGAQLYAKLSGEISLNLIFE